MDSKVYQITAPRTAVLDREVVAQRMAAAFDIFHGAVGICTEAGELMEQMKKHIFYGKPLDDINVKEEVGDLLWYLALTCKGAGFTFEEAMEANIAKLKARYPAGVFDEKFCHDRDHEAERKAIDGANLVAMFQEAVKDPNFTLIVPTPDGPRELVLRPLKL